MGTFWLKFGTEGSDGVCVSPVSVKCTQDCFQIESVPTDYSKKRAKFVFPLPV